MQDTPGKRYACREENDIADLAEQDLGSHDLRKNQKRSQNEDYCWPAEPSIGHNQWNRERRHAAEERDQSHHHGTQHPTGLKRLQQLRRRLCVGSIRDIASDQHLGHEDCTKRRYSHEDENAGGVPHCRLALGCQAGKSKDSRD